MEKIYQQALLYDFYGELLTEHQRSVYEDAVCNDLSLGEIALERGISRQGVHDLIRRCDRILQDYEARLHLVETFVDARDKVEKIIALTQGQEAGLCEERLQEIQHLAVELRQKL
ncbi:MAG: DNA-binding protein [bacterium]|nr:DNA-binding protein [bacterium]